MDPRSTEAQAGRASRVGGTHWFIWALLFFIFLYPLSTGPVYKLTQKRLLPGQILFIYRPLLPIMRRIPAAEGFLNWYVNDLWKGRADDMD